VADIYTRRTTARASPRESYVISPGVLFANGRRRPMVVPYRPDDYRETTIKTRSAFVSGWSVSIYARVIVPHGSGATCVPDASPITFLVDPSAGQRRRGTAGQTR